MDNDKFKIWSWRRPTMMIDPSSDDLLIFKHHVKISDRLLPSDWESLIRWIYKLGLDNWRRMPHTDNIDPFYCNVYCFKNIEAATEFKLRFG